MPNPFSEESRAKAAKTRKDLMSKRGKMPRVYPPPIFPELTSSQNILLAALWREGAVLSEFEDGWITFNKHGGRHGKTTSTDAMVLREYGVAVRFGSWGSPAKWQLDPALRADANKWRKDHSMNMRGPTS